MVVTLHLRALRSTDRAVVEPRFVVQREDEHFTSESGLCLCLSIECPYNKRLTNLHSQGS